jgi:hypothetical protein
MSRFCPNAPLTDYPVGHCDRRFVQLRRES